MTDKMKSLAGLWQGTTKNGQWKLEGSIEGEKKEELIKILQSHDVVRLLILVNSFKKEDKHPGYNLFATEKIKKGGYTPPVTKDEIPF